MSGINRAAMIGQMLQVLFTKGWAEKIDLRPAPAPFLPQLMSGHRRRSRTPGVEHAAGDKLAKRFAKASARGPRGY